MGPASRIWRIVLAVLLALPAAAIAQEPAQPAAPASPSERPPFKQEELEQLLASIALYPDPLLSQVLMASTYPVEIVEADRWVKQNAQLKGDELAQALEKKPWDASVKSLTSFPDVLAMMSEELDWTVKLGDAFLGQQEQVMQTIQTLRARAKARGNLKSTEQQTVTEEPAAEAGQQIIVIEPAQPDVIYVPAYDPWVAYGYWPYPDYAPYYYPWPWFWGGAGISFGVGVGLGFGWGYAWGYPDWHRHHVYVDHHRHAHYNRHIHHEKYLGSDAHRRGPHRWSHQPAHRQGLSYRNRAMAERYQGRGWTTGAVRARESFRGRADQGRRAISSGAVDRSQTYTPRRSQLTSAPLTRRSEGSTVDRAPRGSVQPRGTGSTIRRGAAFGSSSDRARIPTRASSERGHSSRAYSGQGRSFSSPRFQGSRSSGGTIRSVRPGGSSFRGVSPGRSTFRGVSPGGSTFRGVRPSGSTFRGGAIRGGGSTFRGGGGAFRGGGFHGGGGSRGGGSRGGGGRR